MSDCENVENGFPPCDLVTQQTERIKELDVEREGLYDSVGVLSNLLERTANALKGEATELSMHSFHDLPEVAMALREAHQKTLDDSEIGVVPRSHLNHIAALLEKADERFT